MPFNINPFVAFFILIILFLIALRKPLEEWFEQEIKNQIDKGAENLKEELFGKDE